MQRRLRKRDIKAILAITIGASVLVAQHFGWIRTSTQVLQQNQPGLYNVTRFDDGDTIVVDMNGTKETIRFIGVDTPETHDPRKVVQCFGQAASEFTKHLIGTSSIRLESDRLSSNRDRYNRLLRYVYLPNGTLVNQELISQGYGFAYTGFPFTKSEEFVRSQTDARNQNRGLWHACQPTKNSFGGYTSNAAD